MKNAITTCVLHHPARPGKCLARALASLDKATELPHYVEVIVQGPLEDGAVLPAPEQYSNIELVYYHNKENLGSALPLVHSVERFLKTDHAWWAKCDDDMSFDPGAWDIAIRTLNKEDEIGEFNCGCSMIAVPMPMWSARPRNFWYQPLQNGKKALRWHERGYKTRNKGKKPEWVVCDFADHGCTVFKRAVFEAGCIADARYFTGGIDFDLCMQMLDKGFKSILTTNPRCRHHHGECKPFKYGVIRYDPDQTKRSARIFAQKWGCVIPFLADFKGLPQFMRQKTRRR